MIEPTARNKSSGRSRGFRAPRCPACQLLTQVCICGHTPRIRTPAQFWILIHPDEARKPTNTARLIGASMPQSRCFVWRREADADFLALLADGRYRPYLVFPHGDEQLFARLPAAQPPSQPTPAFVLLDGSWDQARRMFQRSGYLRRLPHLSLPPGAHSTYAVRRERRAGFLSTVETAVALLAQVEEREASQRLADYFRIFTASALASRHGGARRGTSGRGALWKDA